MILLDTHIWYRWVADHAHLTAKQLQDLQNNESHGLGVSVISCWEIAKLASLGRLSLGRPLPDWMALALAFRGCILLGLTPDIAIESNQLPGTFHRDPADQMIVATARILGISLLTADAKILAYPHVNLLT